MHSSYKNFIVDYDRERQSFRACYQNRPLLLEFLRDTQLTISAADGSSHTLAEYQLDDCATQDDLDHLSRVLKFSHGPAGIDTVSIHIHLSNRSLCIAIFCCGSTEFNGTLLWGEDPAQSTLAICQEQDSTALHCAAGPAAAPGCDALFDRASDRLLSFAGATVCFDWDQGQYAFRCQAPSGLACRVTFLVRENYCREKFNIPYRGIDKSHGFLTPPVGWMTWYAVRFEASAAVVLENARALVEKLGKYCDRMVLWVDWEWCHHALSVPTADSDIFHPRTDVYPDGLAPVADALKELGLTPALWIGASNDGQLNRELLAHPEWVLGEKQTWCGRWWIDPSHPGVIREYIPKVFQQVLDWGFEAVKWDCIAISMMVSDEFHHRFARPQLSSAAAFRETAAAARHALGQDVYFLSCSVLNERDICTAMDFFNASRIGGDIFDWQEFISNAVERLLHFYPFHNTAFYADADNLVLRREYNTLAEARSRVSLYGLLGLPVTIGDRFADLDEPRLDMLRRIIPVVDTHPQFLGRQKLSSEFLLVRENVCRCYGSWQVAAVFNLAQSSAEYNLPLDGQTAVFDFWQQRFLGVFSGCVALCLERHDVAVLRLTPVQDYPQVISTSRHITQGGFDLLELTWQEQNQCLSGRSRCVGGERYVVTLLCPDKYSYQGLDCQSEGEVDNSGEVLRLIIHPRENCDLSWRLQFARK